MDRQSMHNECVCNQNACEPFVKCAQAHLVPQAPIFESWCAQPFPMSVQTYQIKQFKHISKILYMANRSWIV